MLPISKHTQPGGTLSDAGTLYRRSRNINILIIRPRIPICTHRLTRIIRGRTGHNTSVLVFVSNISE